MKKPIEHWKRSLVKTLTYRAAIIILDFVAVSLLTGKYTIAVIFVVVSNLYTSIAYFIHERIWAKIKWGKDRNKYHNV
ncbi:MAG TPA: DUF2061 domain-containing protein [Patescibacteria group bacterium]|nr:DUF2061 domain-containing protein [Patescibacteria group bacterium]